MAMQNVYKRKIEELRGVIDICNDWEKKFVRSMVKAVKEDYTLTDSQVKKLDEIYQSRVEKKEDGGASINNELIDFGKAKALLDPDRGWQVEYDEQTLGEPVNKHEALIITSWLAKSMDDIEIAVLVNQTANETNNTDTEADPF